MDNDQDRLSPAEHERLMNAISELSRDNPAVIDQLERLAEIKNTNPALWEAGKKILKL